MRLLAMLALALATVVITELPFMAVARVAHAVPIDGVFDWLSPVPVAAPTIPEIVCSYSWSCRGALRVMACESSGNPNAFDGVNVGLFQVAPRFHSWRLAPGESLWDPAVNARIAHEIFVEQGRTPWPVCGRYF